MLLSNVYAVEACATGRLGANYLPLLLQACATTEQTLRVVQMAVQSTVDALDKAPLCAFWPLLPESICFGVML